MLNDPIVCDDFNVIIFFYFIGLFLILDDEKKYLNELNGRKDPVPFSKNLINYLFYRQFFYILC